MSRTGENITKRKDGRWESRYIKYYENGKAVYGYLYGRSYEEALEKKKNIQKDIEKLLSEDVNIKFSSLTEAYLRQKKYQVKESTFVHYKSIINTHILPFFGEINIQDITAESIEKFISYELSNGKLNSFGGMSPKSVKDTLSLLKSIIKYGIQKDIVSEKVIMGVKSPKVNKKNIEIFSEKERKLLEKCTLASDNMYFGIYLCLYTGLRIGEICALTWGDINESIGCISVNKTLLRITNTEEGKSKTKLLIDTPKTSSSVRIIPMSSKLAQMVSNRRQKDTSNNTFFLTGTEKFIEPRNYYEKYKKLLRKCGIRPHTFHSLRHTFATSCIEKGFDAKVLSEILGHSDVKITLDRYVHPSLERKRKCMELL